MKTYKNILLTAAMVAVAVPMTAYAWHGNGNGPRGFDNDNAPRAHCYWGDDQGGPRGYQHAPRHGYMGGHAVRTFGMDAQEARLFMDDVKKVLGISAKEDKAWGAMSSAYVNLAVTRIVHRDEHREARKMDHQQFLEHRSQWMGDHAKAFDAFVKARAQLVKTLSAEQVDRMDYILGTGRLAHHMNGDFGRAGDVQKKVPIK